MCMCMCVCGCGCGCVWCLSPSECVCISISVRRYWSVSVGTICMLVSVCLCIYVCLCVSVPLCLCVSVSLCLFCVTILYLGMCKSYPPLCSCSPLLLAPPLLSSLRLLLFSLLLLSSPLLPAPLAPRRARERVVTSPKKPHYQNCTFWRGSSFRGSLTIQHFCRTKRPRSDLRVSPAGERVVFAHVVYVSTGFVHVAACSLFVSHYPGHTTLF